MIGKPLAMKRGRLARWAAGALFLAASLTGGRGLAQTGTTLASGPVISGHTADRIPTTDTSGASGSGLVQTGCSSCGNGCGSGLGSLCGPGELGSGGCGTCCYPGRNFCCSDCDSCPTAFGKLLCGFYQCVCCPDPCYDPCWLPVADTAFFVDAARPVTQMRLRYDGGWGLKFPDRAEWFYARARTTPNQIGPGGVCAKTGFGKGPNFIASEVDFQDLSLYIEAAQGAFSAFIETPYRDLDPTTGAASITRPLVPAPPLMQAFPGTTAANGTLVPAGAGPLPNDIILGNNGMGVGALVPPALPGTTATTIPAGTRITKGTVLAAGTQISQGTVTVVPQFAFGAPTGNPACQVSGFADIILGTKSMLLDCCLGQITFQFKTFLPTGNFTKGLGTGHVSLEPSILFNIYVARDTYIQGQVAYWIPIGGDDLYQGNIFHAHLALNRVLWRPCPSVQIVGTIEASEWSILGGAYTDPNVRGNGVDVTGNPVMNAPIARSARGDWLSMGPGVRLFICDKLDFGVGTAFAVTSESWAQQEVRADFRWRY